jgi:uncharacterized NAD(P)/FAD-binding protein YdhS
MDAERDVARHHIAVIGGGFSGAVLALQLARKAVSPLLISIYEPRPSLGAGVAYSTPDPAHRINVPAARMTIFPETPAHFHDWLVQNEKISDDVEMAMPDGALYPSRAVFGCYIAGLLAQEGKQPGFARIQHIRETACAITKGKAGYIIETPRGACQAADAVVLAVSHPPPRIPPLIAQHLASDPRVITNPWSDTALDDIQPADDVLIMGTGLTMADVVASLSRRGHRGQITGFSRRGLFSRGHDFSIPTSTAFDSLASPATALALLQCVRREISASAQAGLPWQPIIDGVRANGQRIWGALNEAERARLLRHLRTYWDVHRYRVAPQVEAVLRAKQEDDSLHIFAASLQELTADGDKITAGLRPRHGAPGSTERISVDRIIVTTGPSHGSVIEQNMALQSLARQNLIRPDHLGLGIAVNPASQTIRPDGQSNLTLWVAGPLARSNFGELMGLPQVAAHASSVAEQIANWLTATEEAVTGETQIMPA